jgi:hypothetical protein
MNPIFQMITKWAIPAIMQSLPPTLFLSLGNYIIELDPFCQGNSLQNFLLLALSCKLSKCPQLEVEKRKKDAISFN